MRIFGLFNEFIPQKSFLKNFSSPLPLIIFREYHIIRYKVSK